ncbi:DUF4112 domain-containing protein [Calycomorphotria hydatis]|uniref:DUF4112 domain-containing protein n=1 Tax=Calycomorphotria hydatis TaxID=2528027 RepID=A0A517TF01_9PLAN|nr:DUF4112 domain-containing protein [Calycomorphotria hydatis]QDT66951.1 hypothetical protein V22_42230 [Calycomorphotria hydatis]
MSDDSKNSTPKIDPRLKRARWLAWFLDDSIRIPGTKYRFGWDGLIGLAPGAGDVITAAIACSIIIDAARLGASRGTIMKMIANVLIDMLVGAIPGLGDVLDFAFKANKRNMAMLEKELEELGTLTQEPEEEESVIETTAERVE